MDYFLFNFSGVQFHYTMSLILKFSSLRFFSKKAEKSASTGASGATGAKRTVKAAHKKLPAKGPRPSAGSKIHFKP